MLKCPGSVIDRIERLQRDFLWHWRENKKKFRLVDWKSICTLKKKGGVGFHPLRGMTKALLGKWLWRIGEHSNSLWRNVISSKYNVRRNGWDIPDKSLGCSSFWKGITSVKELFEASIEYRIESRDGISFWLDVWVGDKPLAIQFPGLYNCVRNREAKINDYLDKSFHQV